MQGKTAEKGPESPPLRAFFPHPLPRAVSGGSSSRNSPCRVQAAPAGLGPLPPLGCQFWGLTLSL